MAVDKHPSRRPSPPREMPASGPGAPPKLKAEIHEGSGQHGVPYGFKHELRVSSTPHKSEMAHHFHDHHKGKAPHAGREEAEEPRHHHVGKAHRPGDEKHDDEPG